MNANVRELTNGTFQFFLWANKDELNKSTSLIDDDDNSDFSGEEVYIDHKLVGECFVSMNKFLLWRCRDCKCE